MFTIQTAALHARPVCAPFTARAASSSVPAVAPTVRGASSGLRSSRGLPPHHSRTSASARRSSPQRSITTTMAQAEDLAPVTLVGGGRVGQALQGMGPGTDKVIGRGDPMDALPGPILVCTRNDSLQGIVDATPEDRRSDLVFLQNGMLQPWLDSAGLGDNTQVLVYFAVAKLGDKPTDGKTDVNPEGLTAAYGKHAQAVADRLANGGMSCKVMDLVPFKRAMLEKLIWICAFMLVGAKNGCTVGEVEQNHQDDVNTLIRELAAAGEAEMGIELDAGCVERLNAYARTVAHFPTAVKEFEWRNGWFYNISTKAIEAGKTDPCPTHTAWLKEVGAI